MVIQRASQLQAEGFTVYVEYANSLKVNGKIFDICVAGRPDIVAIKDNWVVVEDCKTVPLLQYPRHTLPNTQCVQTCTR
jgi:hypothetical protein